MSVLYIFSLSLCNATLTFPLLIRLFPFTSVYFLSRFLSILLLLSLMPYYFLYASLCFFLLYRTNSPAIHPKPKLLSLIVLTLTTQRSGSHSLQTSLSHSFLLPLSIFSLFPDPRKETFLPSTVQ